MSLGEARTKSDIQMRHLPRRFESLNNWKVPLNATRRLPRMSTEFKAPELCRIQGANCLWSFLFEIWSKAEISQIASFVLRMTFLHNFFLNIIFTKSLKRNVKDTFKSFDTAKLEIPPSPRGAENRKAFSVGRYMLKALRPFKDRGLISPGHLLNALDFYNN